MGFMGEPPKGPPRYCSNQAMLPLRSSLTGPFNFLGRELRTSSAGSCRTPSRSCRRSCRRSSRRTKPQPRCSAIRCSPTPELAALDRAFERLPRRRRRRSSTRPCSASPSTRRAFAGAWERYRLLLTRATENSITASYGRSFPGIFWLYHSRRHRPELQGDDEAPAAARSGVGATATATSSATASTIACSTGFRTSPTTWSTGSPRDTEEVEQQIFPILLTRMKDNVLIFTEDHISPNLAELASYFSGCLKLDGRDFRLRLMRVHEWYSGALRRDEEFVHSSPPARRRAGPGAPAAPQPSRLPDLPRRPSDLRPRFLLPPAWIQVWESLLVKLKEFELFNALRRSIVGVERDGDHVLSAASASSAGVGGATTPLPALGQHPPARLHGALGVDPLVARFGLIYDISDFTETVSLLRRSGALEQDRSFRMMFRFQRKVNRLASQHKAKLEKYLGDGAFYSSREAHPCSCWRCRSSAPTARRSPRASRSRRACASPSTTASTGCCRSRSAPRRSCDRYEFFGHGVVELTRLTTGKASREIDEIKTLLITLRLPGVDRQPVLRADDPAEPRRRQQDRGDARFLLLHQPNGSLVNEGIVATLDFISRLEKESVAAAIFRLLDGERTYVALKVDTPGGSLLVGIRKLGVAHLKGLDRLPIYEIVDASLWGDNTLVELRGSLMELIEREFNSAPEPSDGCQANREQGERSTVSTGDNGLTSGRPTSRPAGAPARQGPRHLRPRRPPPAGRDRPALGLRPHPAAGDPRQGPDPHPAHQLLDGAPRRPDRPEPPPRHRGRRLPGRASPLCRAARRPGGGRAQGGGCRLRVRGARFSRRQRLQGVPGGGTACGIALPPGLERASRLPEPIFTPATKAESGHDENVSFAHPRAGVGAATASRLRELTLALYRAGARARRVARPAARRHQVRVRLRRRRASS